MKVLTRYIALEVLQRVLLFMGVLTTLLVAGRGVEFVKQMANGELPGEAVITILVLAIPKILALALPLAFFFGLLTTIGRLCLDSEMDAMAAAGYGLYSVLPVIVALGVIGMLAEAGITLWVQPWGESRMAKAVSGLQQQALTSMIREGEFNELPGGRVLFFEKRAGDGRLKDVFFYDPQAQPPMALTAKQGELTPGKKGELEVAFFHGLRYQGRPAEELARVLEFQRYRVRQSFGGFGKPKAGRNIVPSVDLWHEAWGGGEEAKASRVELYRRLSLPLSVPVLMLLALPLGVENRRSGTRSYGILWGALIILLYQNVLIILEEWGLKGGSMPSALLWAPPVFLGVFSLLLLYRTVQGLPLVPRLKQLSPAPGRRLGGSNS